MTEWFSREWLLAGESFRAETMNPVYSATMKNKLQISSFILFALVCAAAQKPVPATYEQQIAKLEDECLHATLTGDASFGEKYFADDYVQISLGGAESNKQFQVEIKRTGNIKYERLDLQKRKIRIYGETAVVNMESLAKYTVRDKQIEGLFRATRVWVRANGEWKIVAFQTNKVDEVKK